MNYETKNITRCPEDTKEWRVVLHHSRNRLPDTILIAPPSILETGEAVEMFAYRDNPMLTKLRQVTLALIFGSGCLLFSGPNLAHEPALPSDQGYMLIRINLGQREKVGILAMSNVDTNDVVRIHTKSFEPLGANSWMALVAMPGGKYFLSEYEPIYGSVDERLLNSTPMFRRRAGDSASDTYEIVSGAVNYVGDWNMNILTSSQQYQLNRTVEYDKATLERYVAKFPEQSNKYEIYFSVMGKEAISLVEMVQTSKE